MYSSYIKRYKDPNICQGGQKVGQGQDPPGPIDNSLVASTRLLFHARGSTPPTFAVKNGSDYGQLSDEMFYFLHEIYGGSPIVLVHPTNVGEPEDEARDRDAGANAEIN